MAVRTLILMISVHIAAGLAPRKLSYERPLCTGLRPSSHGGPIEVDHVFRTTFHRLAEHLLVDFL